jgi:hypothetical protein
MNKPITNGRVTRWLLLLQEFDITIVDKLGKENVVADFLSRITNEGEAIPVEDTFPDEHIFTLSTNTPWFADIANYLACRKSSDTSLTKGKIKYYQTKCNVFLGSRIPLSHRGSHNLMLCLRG